MTYFNIKHCLWAFLLASLCLWGMPRHALCEAAVSAADTYSPKKVWRLAYFEAAEHTYFRTTLIDMAAAMQDAGLIENGRIPQELIDSDDVDTKPIWDWLAANAGGHQVQFLPDGFYSTYWDAEYSKSLVRHLVKRIVGKQDIDLLLTFGTEAGLTAVSAQLPIPVFVLASTDPVSAGIVASISDSGHDNVHAQVDIRHYQQQLRVFHEMFKFKTLGVAYHDTPEGRAVVALPSIEEVCDSLDVEIVRCTPPLQNPRHFKNLKKCMEIFSEDVDAVYMTLNLAAQPARVPELMTPLIRRSIPTFAQGGIDETENGVLMSFSHDSFLQSGIRAVIALQSVMAGTLPRHIEQEITTPLNLAINLRTAQDMYWDIPFEVLLAADVLFHKDGKFE